MRIRNTFRALPRRQRLLLISIAVFNAVVLLVLALLLFTDQPVEPVATLTDNSQQCEEVAALKMRQEGVAASLTIENRALLARVDGPSAEAWDVFSVTARLVPLGCGPYNLIRVDVPDPTERPNVRLTLELTGPELQYWLDGVLNDAQLADRMRRQLYTVAAVVTPTP